MYFAKIVEAQSTSQICYILSVGIKSVDHVDTTPLSKVEFVYAADPRLSKLMLWELYYNNAHDVIKKNLMQLSFLILYYATCIHLFAKIALELILINALYEIYHFPMKRKWMC